jgi:hemerythrin superfamily protein
MSVQSRQTQPDVVDLLMQQHEEARRLFVDVKAATGDGRQEPFTRLLTLLAVHETAEEEIVYPALRAIDGEGQRLADARTAEEDRVKKELSELERIGVGSPRFEPELDHVEQLVLMHADNEEREVFPRLRSSYSLEELQALARAFEAARAVAPTHPHALAPEGAIGNLVAGPFVAIVDRVRDAIRQRAG